MQVIGNNEECGLKLLNLHDQHSGPIRFLEWERAYICSHCYGAFSQTVIHSYILQAHNIQKTLNNQRMAESISLGPVGHLWAQAEKKVSDRCDACGHLLEVGYSTKHQSWLCREHFNHHNVEDMIFGQKVINQTPEEAVIHMRTGSYDHLRSLHDNDAIDTNEQGGKQSHLEYRFDLIEPEFMLRMAHVLYTGSLKYGDRNWQSIPMDHNIGRAIYHLEMALQGIDHSEDHFANAACRVMFAMLTAYGTRYPSGKI